MKHRSPVVATALVLGLALAGCAGGSGEKGETTAAVDPDQLTATTEPGTQPVDVVRWGMMTEPGTVDPVRVGVDVEYQTVANMCDTLLRLQPDFSVAPGVAVSAEWTDDSTFVIDLRDDVTFWDGAELTAEDVAYSLNRSADPESQSVNTSAFSSVKSITATGPLQVTVTFTEPDSQFRNSMAGPAGYVFQKAFTESVGEKAIGTADGGIMCTGPFELEKWEAGQRATLTANPDYWDGAPLVQTLELEFLSSDSTLTSALLSGELDGTLEAPASSAASLIESGVGTLYVGPSTASISFGPTTAEGPAADPRVREALDLAIDKEGYIEAVLNGYGAPLRTFVPPFAWEGLEAGDTYRAGYDALPDNSKADLDRAKELIAEANPEKKTLVFAIVAGEEESLRSATIVQAAGKSIGLDIEIKQLQGNDFAALFYEEGARAGIDFLGTTGYQDTPGVLGYPSLFALPGSLFNWSEYDNADVTALLGQARAETDPAASAEAFVKAQAIYGPERLQVSLAQKYTRVFLSEDLTGVTTSFAYIASPWALRLGGK